MYALSSPHIRTNTHVVMFTGLYHVDVVMVNVDVLLRVDRYVWRLARFVVVLSGLCIM